MTRRLVEIDSLSAFDNHVAGRVRMNGWVVQSLDLTDRSEVLLANDPRGAVFLGCHFAPAVETELRHRGALLFPRLPHLPFDPYRPALYDAAELYGAGSYAESPDAAIPTWFYGHEPTNVFATGIAKYFANALREDTLLHRCRGGIVYLPGQAGTVQEIFQAVTENFYAADASLVAPMVLVGVEYWTSTYPAWPLLQRLGAGRPMGAVVHCVDTVDEAASLLSEPHAPAPAATA
jgi:hypothetical protein